MAGAEGVWTRSPTIEDFSRTAIPVLEREPALNTQLLTVFERLRREGPRAFGERDPQMLTWRARPGAAVDAAVLRTPPYAYILSGNPTRECAWALADLLLDPAAGLDGHEINLPGACEESFVAAWTAHTGHASRVAERNRLYRLAGHRDPDPMPPGRARLAQAEDVPLVARFLEGFWRSVEHAIVPRGGVTALRIAEARVAEGGFWLWLDREDRPVSLAGSTPIVAGTGRIGPVYTPSRLRGRGYAGAVTAAAGRALLDRGAAQVLLFTDLANPTSNALYQRIGYRPVSDRVRLELTASRGTPTAPTR